MRDSVTTSVTRRDPYELDRLFAGRGLWGHLFLSLLVVLLKNANSDEHPLLIVADDDKHHQIAFLAAHIVVNNVGAFVPIGCNSQVSLQSCCSCLSSQRNLPHTYSPCLRILSSKSTNIYT